MSMSIASCWGTANMGPVRRWKREYPESEDEVVEGRRCSASARPTMWEFGGVGCV